MTEDELIALADANYFDSWSLIAEQCPEGRARRRPGLVLASSGLPLPILNVAFVTQPVNDPAATVAEAAAFYAEAPVPWLLRIRSGLDERFDSLRDLQRRFLAPVRRAGTVLLPHGGPCGRAQSTANR